MSRLRVSFVIFVFVSPVHTGGERGDSAHCAAFDAASIRRRTARRVVADRASRRALRRLQRRRFAGARFLFDSSLVTCESISLCFAPRLSLARCRLSRSEVAAVVRDACLTALRGDIGCQFVTEAHLEAAIRATKKQITPEMLKFYHDYNASRAKQ